MIDDQGDELDCLDQGGELDCFGPVEGRVSLTGTGMVIPRCGAHWARRLELEDRIRADYPDSDQAPAWFDEAAAGERWNDDY